MSRLQLNSFSFSAMGTACELHLYLDSGQEARQVATAAFAETARLEQQYSRYRSDSMLANLNAIASQSGSLTVDEETSGLLDYAFLCYRNSDGLFDITSGLLRKAWNFSVPSLPLQEEIDRLLPLVGMDKLEWEPPMLRIPLAGMEIDLGGIVKEYAADRMASICADLGVRHGVVELGGDIRVIGPHPDGSPWQVRIRHPRQSDAAIAVIAVAEGAVASSGDYERFFEIDGRRYSHLLDPQTGWPVQGLAAVSVTAESCLVAGSIASIAMLKQTDGSAWLTGLNVDYLWMDIEGKQGGPLLSPNPKPPLS